MELKEHLLRHLEAKEVESLLESINSESVNSLYLNPGVYSGERLLEDYPLVKAHPFLKDTFYYPKEYNFGKKILFDLGCYYIQDASATVVPFILDPQPNERILDMCASPGGKAIRIASLMENTGVLVANDNSFERIKILNQNIERFGLVNVLVTTNNMLYFVEDYENYFDRVLLDAPCSGSGMARKEPKMLRDWSHNKVIKLTENQNALLENAIRFCKPNGIIVYSTCSFSFEENEAVIQKALNSGLVELIKISPFPGSFHHKDMPETLRLHPNHYDGEGQFVAKLRKRAFTIANASVKSDKNFKIKPLFKDVTQFPYVKYYIDRKDTLFGTSFNEDLKFFQIFQVGMEIGRKEKFGFVYHHESSRLLPTSSSIKLDRSQAEAYIRGEELELSFPDGWSVVKYQELNLGYVRIKGNRAKNYYPKGLRKNALEF